MKDILEVLKQFFNGFVTGAIVVGAVYAVFLLIF